MTLLAVEDDAEVYGARLRHEPAGPGGGSGIETVRGVGYRVRRS